MRQRYLLPLDLPLPLFWKSPIQSAATSELGSHQSLALIEDSVGEFSTWILISCGIGEAMLLNKAAMDLVNVTGEENREETAQYCEGIHCLSCRWNATSSPTFKSRIVLCEPPVHVLSSSPGHEHTGFRPAAVFLPCQRS